MLSRWLSEAALLGCTAALMVGCATNDEAGAASWAKQPEPAPEIAGLSVTRGAPFSLRQERGKVVLLSFGYTSCLELCPDTFSAAKRVLNKLGGAASGLRFAYVTVDPERDRPEPFAQFIASVDPRFEGVYLEGAALAPVLAAYGVTVRKRLPTPDGYANRSRDPARFYSMDHTSGFWLIDREGRLRVRYAHDASDAELLEGAHRLLSEPA